MYGIISDLEAATEAMATLSVVVRLFIDAASHNMFEQGALISFSLLI